MFNASCSIELISPETAQRLLDSQYSKQRNARQSAINRLAATIKAGEWKLTSDAIAIIKGRLGNGQHRLKAVVLAGESVPVLVLRTDDETIFDVLDSGIGRTIGDVLAQQGIEASSHIAAISKNLLSFKKGMLTKSGDGHGSDVSSKDPGKIIRRQDVIAFAEESKDAILEAYAYIKPLHAKTPLMPITWATTFLTLAGKKNSLVSKIFIENVYNGNHHGVSEMIHNTLLKNRLTSRKMTGPNMLAILIKGYNAELLGESPKVLSMKKDEKFPAFA